MGMLAACIWLANWCHPMGSDVLRFRSISWTRSTTLLPGMATPSCSNSPLSFHFVVFKRDTNWLPFSCSVLGSVVTTSAITSVGTIGSFSFTTTTGVGLAARSLAMSLYRSKAWLYRRTFSLMPTSLLSSMLVISASRSSSVVSTGVCVGVRNVSNSRGSTSAIFRTCDI